MTFLLHDIPSIIINNIISTTLYNQQENLYKKFKLFLFRKQLRRDISNYISFHSDCYILSTELFENFVRNYNVIENILIHLLENNDSMTKNNFIEKLTVHFNCSGPSSSYKTVNDCNDVSHFLLFLYNKIDSFFKQKLSDKERYFLQKTITANEEIKAYIKLCTNKIDNKFNDLKESSFNNILKTTICEKQKTDNRFHYLNKNLNNIYGRDQHLALLYDFLNDSANFSFCVITGPAGIGKNKLAYSFMQQQKEKNNDWKMFFINTNTLNALTSCEDWNFTFNTLLIVDYAAQSQESLHKVFVKISKHERAFNHKLRILLLDRVGMIKKHNPNTNETIEEYPHWYKTIINPQRNDYYIDTDYISKFLFTEFIELEGLSDDDYKHLITDFYAFSKENNQTTNSLSLEQISKIIDFSRRTSNSLTNSRPIYIMLATDAVIHGLDISSWGPSHMMKDIYNRDRKQWKETIQDFTLFRSLENALIYATIFGEWIIGHPFEIAHNNVCLNIENGLQNPDRQGVITDWLIQMGELPNENKPWRLKSYEPDIVGEFYVLNQLKNCISSLNDWCNLIFCKLSKSKDFLQRACQDYINTDLGEFLITIFNELTKRITVEDVEKAEYTLTLWEFLFSETINKTNKGTALNNIFDISKKFFGRSEHIDETYVRLFIVSPSDHTNSWRKQHLPHLKQLYTKWSDSVIITSTYIDMLGAMASWSYRNGNLPKGNIYSKMLNTVIGHCNINDENILTNYINALGYIISGHYYMHDDTNIEAEIDDDFKLEVLVEKLKTEAHAVAYANAIKNTLTQQSKYTTDTRILKSIEQFCLHIQKWIQNKEWYIFRWNIGSILPFAIELLFSYNKPISAEKLLDNYLEIVTKYINIQYQSPELMIAHFSTGIDKLIKSEMIPPKVKKNILQKTENGYRVV